MHFCLRVYDNTWILFSIPLFFGLHTLVSSRLRFHSTIYKLAVETTRGAEAGEKERKFTALKVLSASQVSLARHHTPQINHD